MILPYRLTLPLVIAALTGACSPVPNDRSAQSPGRQNLLKTVEASVDGGPAESCLLMVWSEQEEDSDIEFDRANDTVKGGAISCATGATPSQFEAAIAALRDAARSGNKARILDQIGIPLLYIAPDGERHELTKDQIDTLFDDVFDARMLDLLQRLDLSKMTVEKDQGAFFELGSLWLVVDESGQPRVMTVNRQALDEAAVAARDQAERGQGEPIE